MIRPKRRCAQQHQDADYLTCYATAFNLTEDATKINDTLRNLRRIWAPDNHLKDSKFKLQIPDHVFCSLNGQETLKETAVPMLKGAYNEQYVGNFSDLIALRVKESKDPFKSVFLSMEIGREILHQTDSKKVVAEILKLLEYEEKTHALFCPIQLKYVKGTKYNGHAFALICFDFSGKDSKLYIFSNLHKKLKDECNAALNAFREVAEELSYCVTNAENRNPVLTCAAINAGVDLSTIAEIHSGPLACVLMDVLSQSDVSCESVGEYVQNSDMKKIRAMRFLFMSGFHI